MEEIPYAQGSALVSATLVRCYALACRRPRPDRRRLRPLGGLSSDNRPCADDASSRLWFAGPCRGLRSTRLWFAVDVATRCRIRKGRTTRSPSTCPAAGAVPAHNPRPTAGRPGTEHPATPTAYALAGTTRRRRLQAGGSSEHRLDGSTQPVRSSRRYLLS